MKLGKIAIRLVTSIMMLGMFGLALPDSEAHALVCPGSLTGGTVTADGDDCVLQFTTVGSTTWTPPAGITKVDVLVVGGGGGGGADAAGGGGAGGYIYEQDYTVTGTVSIAVGDGGVGGRNSTGTVAAAGSPSMFGSLTANGGGKGGTYNGGAGGNGASSGGGGFVNGLAGTPTTGQGNTGGNGGSMWSCACPGGGGGGGAGGAGVNGNTADGNGGPGLQNSITGTARWYAAGGGGGRWGVVTNVENGGSGIGGRGAGSCGANPSMPGTANTGSGGGGAPAGCQTYGSAGGSGIVIVRYSLPDVAAPSFVSGSMNASGTILTLTFNEAISSTIASNGAFIVKADGQTVSVSGVTVSGSTVRLAMSNAIWVGATVTVAYTDPSGADDSNAVQDLAGNDASSIPAAQVTNNSTVTTTTTTTTSTTTTSTTTTVAPAAVLNIQAPVSTVAVGQASVATIGPRTNASSSTTIAKLSTTTAAPAASTTTSTPPSSLPKKSNNPPDVPNIKTGESALTVGDKKTDVVVTRENNQLVISSGAVNAVLSGLDEVGGNRPLDAEGNLRLNGGDVIKINLGGFKPNTEAEVWLFSTPALLGTALVGADGTVSNSFTIPKDIENGAHRIAVKAKMPNGETATIALGIVIGEIARTSTLTRVLIAIPIAFAIGIGMLLPNQLRRRRKNLLA